MASFQGLSPSSEAIRLFEENSIGGLFLFGENCPSVKKTHDNIMMLKAHAPKDLPLCVAVDHEGGRVHRLPKPVIHFPPMRLLGALYERLPSSKLAVAVGKVMAKELKEIGINLNFSPVVDVDTNPLNPVIGDRSFSNNPEVVSLVARQLIQGLQEGGLAACAKHFPGHGDTDGDSHKVLPHLPHNRKRLNAVELAPYRAVIQQNVSAIMTAHVVYDGIDKGVPATLSVKILRDILRNDLGFQGLIVSDAFNMKAIADHWPMEEAAVQSFNAGCDLLLTIGVELKKIKQVIDFFTKAVREKRIPEERIDESFARIVAFKKKYCVRSGAFIPDYTIIGCSEHKKILNKFKEFVV